MLIYYFRLLTIALLSAVPGKLLVSERLTVSVVVRFVLKSFFDRVLT